MCDNVCTYIAGSTVCTSCEAGKHKAAAGINTACDECSAGKYSATAGVEIVCVVCVSKKKKAGYIHTLSHTIHT